MRRLTSVVSLAASLALVISLLLGAVALVAFDMGFYENEYQKYGQAQVIGISDKGLMEITENLVDYLKGSRDDLNMRATIQDQEQEVFGEREKAHMVDVRLLFDRGFIILYVCLGLVILGYGFVIAYRRKQALPILAKSFLWAMAIIAVLMATLGIYMAVDFNGAFTNFHLLLFDNDLWLLNPATDVLINMVPEAFFYDTAFRIVAFFAAACAVLGLLSGGYLVWRKKGGSRRALSGSNEA